MASGNFLTVKTHLSEFKNNSDKDTVSEVSLLQYRYSRVTKKSLSIIALCSYASAILKMFVA